MYKYKPIQSGVPDGSRNRRQGPVQGRASMGQGGATGQPATFFNRGRQEGGLQVGQGQQPRQNRSCSSSKRQWTDDEGGRQEQRPYRSGGRQQRAARPNAQVVKGSSTEFADLVGPVTWWVGKCRPETREDKVKEVLRDEDN